MNSKIILTIVVILLVAGGAVYYVILQEDQGVQETIKETATDSGDGVIQRVDRTKPDDTVNDNRGVEIEQAAISDWKIFTNARFGYKFNYPPSANALPEILEPRKEGAFYIDDNVTTLTQPSDVVLFQVVSLEDELSTKEYAEKVWIMNKEDSNQNIKEKTVGDMTILIVNGIETYQFTVSGSFKWDDGGYVLDQENVYVYVGTNGKVYQIRFPTENQEVSQKILSTFELISP
jgi:hypothetical protein